MCGKSSRIAVTATASCLWLTRSFLTASLTMLPCYDVTMAHAMFGFEPDLVALGNITGGGLPVGVGAGPASHMAVFHHTRGKPAVPHGGTFSANPLSMTAGLAAVQSYTQNAVTRLNQMGDTLRSETIEQLRRRELPAQVTGTSSLFRLNLKTEVIRNYRTSFPSALQKAALAKVHLAMLERVF